MNKFIRVLAISITFSILLALISCKKEDKSVAKLKAEQETLLTILKNGQDNTLDKRQEKEQNKDFRQEKYGNDARDNTSKEEKTVHYALMNKIASNYLTLKEEQNAILFLTSYVDKNPKDSYNPYWLLLTSYAYMNIDCAPIAEYYFDRVLQNYQDLLVKGQSLHLLALKNLIRISKNPQNRIKYFCTLIDNFSNEVEPTEVYLRLAIEYEKVNEWDNALASYTTFLSQPNSASIQIADEPNAYKRARQLVGFSNSARDWTFPSLQSLEKAVETAINNYDWRSLDKYKAKVNFFSMSWKQEEIDPNAQEEFSMRSFMRGNKVHCAKRLDRDTTSSEAYLRTWGWSQYVSVWYLYFRKVNYPIDPDINGNWEWAGIYMGEKI